MATTELHHYENVTEYSVNESKHFDMKLGVAKKIVIWGDDEERIRIALLSDTRSNHKDDLKVKFDDIKSRLDVDIKRQKGMTEDIAKEEVTIFVRLPQKYVGKVELAATAETVEVHHLNCESIELDIKAQNVVLGEEIAGAVEINCNLDMDVVCRSLESDLSINQVSADSKLSIPAGTVFTAVTKGIGTSIFYEKDGKPTEAFDSADADNTIELNGMKSKLVICSIED